MEESLDFFTLPEGCVSHLLSLTTPSDACRSALVSPLFHSAAASDTVWDRFLPLDHADLLSRTAYRIEFSSKRELFFRLCDPILIDGDKMSFFLEKSSGRKCFMMSARLLTIIWGDTPHYWRWIRHLDSRFSEVAELLNVCWLEIRGRFDTKMLSPHTKYAAYFVFKLAEHSRGLGWPLQSTAVKIGPHESVNSVSLHPDGERENPVIPPRRRRGRYMGRFMGWHMNALPAEEEAEQQPEQPLAPPVNGPRRREDGWMEVELGEMENELGEDGEVEMSLMEVKGGHWKSGLIVQGIEFRPKN